MERLAAPFTPSEVKPDEGTFAGLAAVYEREFMSPIGPLVIDRGAFAESLQRDAGRVLILWQHDWDEPIGKPTKLADTPEGIEVHGRISQTQRGKDALTLLRDGVVTELSIGLDREEETRGTRAKPTRLHKGRFWEVSLVSWGAAGAEGARVREVHKAVQRQPTKADLEMDRARGLLADLELRFGPIKEPEAPKIPVSEIEKLCPKCAEKMKRFGLKSITLEAFQKAIRAAAFETLQMDEGMCRKVGGGDEGFFTRCTGMQWEGVDDVNAFCAALHEHCIGKPPSAD